MNTQSFTNKVNNVILKLLTVQSWWHLKITSTQTAIQCNKSINKNLDSVRRLIRFVLFCFVSCSLHTLITSRIFLLPLSFPIFLPLSFPLFLTQSLSVSLFLFVWALPLVVVITVASFVIVYDTYRTYYHYLLGQRENIADNQQNNIVVASARFYKRYPQIKGLLVQVMDKNSCLLNH